MLLKLLRTTWRGPQCCWARTFPGLPLPFGMASRAVAARCCAWLDFKSRGYRFLPSAGQPAVLRPHRPLDRAEEAQQKKRPVIYHRLASKVPTPGGGRSQAAPRATCPWWHGYAAGRSAELPCLAARPIDWHEHLENLTLPAEALPASILPRCTSSGSRRGTAHLRHPR